MGRPVNLRDYKTALRLRFKALRHTMPETQKQSADHKIAHRLCAMGIWKKAKTLLIYVSLPIEVDTLELIESALAQGKRVAVPRCLPFCREMEFYLIDSLNELSRGTFGVLEPPPLPAKRMTDWRGSLCVVPALACDSAGYRLGYGGGYYDRFLSRYPGTKVAILYQSCMMGRLYHGRYDVPVDAIVTDHSVARPKREHAAPKTQIRV
ncbi:MAG: 5-formyltetrahydrofolate cyclo-ligase [Oscillospiraceae bacterium]